jgi:hypothetical protein
MIGRSKRKEFDLLAHQISVSIARNLWGHNIN